MIKLNKIYTRTGDSGETGLVDGSTLPKSHVRIAAYGTVDEANAVIGMARLSMADDLDAMLFRVQNDLFDLGADLATPFGDAELEQHALRMHPSQVDRLESEIDQLNEALEPLTSFILPGGTPAAAHLHLARTVMRRAERLMVDAAQEVEINAVALQYANRVSDLLFVMARAANANGAEDVLWVPGKNR